MGTKSQRLTPQEKLVVEEHTKLLSKTRKLERTIYSDNKMKAFSAHEQDLLKTQYLTMIQYLRVLEMRINLFNKGVYLWN